VWLTLMRLLTAFGVIAPPDFPILRKPLHRCLCVSQDEEVEVPLELKIECRILSFIFRPPLSDERVGSERD
jgi:hypothetical protein